MINIKYKVVLAVPWEDDYTDGKETWVVYKTYIPNWEDEDYYGGEQTERKVRLYAGSLSDCESFLTLHKGGYL